MKKPIQTGLDQDDHKAFKKLAGKAKLSEADYLRRIVQSELKTKTVSKKFT